MVTSVGSNKPIIDGHLTQEQCNDLLEDFAAGLSPIAKISHSLERLSHFRCGLCKGWWSVGDWHIRANGRTHMYCTWCGEKQEVAA